MAASTAKSTGRSPHSVGVTATEITSISRAMEDRLRYAIHDHEMGTQSTSTYEKNGQTSEARYESSSYVTPQYGTAASTSQQSASRVIRAEDDTENLHAFTTSHRMPRVTRDGISTQSFGFPTASQTTDIGDSSRREDVKMSVGINSSRSNLGYSESRSASGSHSSVSLEYFESSPAGEVLQRLVSAERVALHVAARADQISTAANSTRFEREKALQMLTIAEETVQTARKAAMHAVSAQKKKRAVSRELPFDRESVTPEEEHKLAEQGKLIVHANTLVLCIGIP